MLFRARNASISKPLTKAGFAARFSRDEDGAMLIFGVYVLIIILMIGGIGVDLMRIERDRTKLQNTLDRAVLAAADLDQQLGPDAVVQNYFEKAGLSEQLTSVSVDQGLGYRVVSGTATTQVETQFMRMTGVDTVSVPAASTAEERIDGVEISLILDVSGSMNQSGRLVNLKSAAKDFVDTVLNSAEDGEVSISLIPYATQVSVGQTLLSEYTVSSEHRFSYCVNFIADEFNNTAIPPTEPLLRTGHFDPWNDDEISVESGHSLVSPVCPTRSNVSILPLSKSRADLKNQIGMLTAQGNTSIDLGMKWGTALLDPETQPVVTNLIASGVISDRFAGRPVNFEATKTMKVVVLMTDGENTDQYRLLPPYRGGNSDVWRKPDNNHYSVLHGGDYYYPDVDGGPMNNLVPDGDTDALRMGYPELWRRGPLAWNAVHNYQKILGNKTAALSIWRDGVTEVFNREYKNARLRKICDVAKDAGIIVFTIGFEAPRRGEAVLRACASSPSHYFDVTGLEIADAFSAIASSIRKLRLTQ